ncbi:MAG: hypothetical protein JJU18_00185 [Oceanicaulis sp.]|nr:hypothetical protein [Oceanicaulis sp.]
MKLNLNLTTLAGALTLGLSSVLTAPALASGGPYAVDDAGIATPGKFKLETWMSVADTDDLIFIASPGYVFEALPWIEFELTYERARRGGDWEDTLAPAVKIALRDVDEHGYGVALSLGSGHAGIVRRADTMYAVVPVTIPAGERLLVNVNAGVERDQETRQTEAVWGVGGQLLFDRGELIAETFGREGGTPGFQAGVRPYLFGGDIALEFAYGRNLDGDRANWLTVGLSFEF